MPAAITHYFHALQVLSRRKTSVSPSAKNAFLWGAQGPDFLFYSRFLQPWKKNLREIGGRLHREKPSRLLLSMRDCMDRGGNERMKFYLGGFLCHYSLDRTVHPFVYADVSAIQEIYLGRSEGFLHNQVESVLDGILLRSITGQLANEFDLKQTVPEDREVQMMMAELYSAVLEQLYGIHGIQTELYQSTKDCRRICGLLNDRTTVKKTSLELFEKITHRYLFSSAVRGICEPDGFDYANVLHSAWKWPADSRVSRQESFFDLFDRSVQESLEFLQKFSGADLFLLTRDTPFC